MGYVYKIQGDFENLNFSNFLESISNNFIFIYIDDTIFVALKNFKDEDKSKNMIKKIINSNNGDLAIVEINKNNIGKLNEVSKEWCLNNLIRLDTNKYEFEKQSQLKAEWLAIDLMEQELNNIKRKEG